MIARASAGGKIILLGEHAVVYGCPAIAAGIELGASATAQLASSSSISVSIELDAATRDDLERAFAALLAELNSCPLKVAIRSDIPAGMGLGASAALGVAVARAVLASNRSSAMDPLAIDDGEQRRRIAAAAAVWENVFHGNSSGLDVAAASLGGCLLFTKGQGPKPLSFAVDIPIAIAIAGPPTKTKVMVEGVAELRRQKPELVDRTIEGIRALVQNAKLALEAGDLPALGRLLDLNQMLLSGLFLSSEAIERACAIARAAGALGAKLTGKGGGGCVIALTNPDPRPVLDAWRSQGIECFSTVIRAPA